MPLTGWRQIARTPTPATVSSAAVLRRRPYTADALGIGVATGVYGVSFGVLAVGAGLSAAQACAMSLLVFTGGSQFAAIGVIAAGGSVAAAIGNALLLGARNTAYGLVVAPLLGRSRLERVVGAQLVIDESTAMARGQAGPADARGAFWVTGVSVFVLWNLGTLAGALAGSGLGDPAALGLDAMFPAAFLALLAPQLRQPGAPRAAVAGALIALALLPLTPAGVPVLAAALGVLAGLRGARTPNRVASRAPGESEATRDRGRGAAG
jgi:4-azaleucine resistance transporter AzlC